MKIAAIIQARIGSKRLSGKVFLSILERPMLWYMINRLKLSEAIDDIILAIPDSKPNDRLADFAGDLSLHCFRGSEDDVLSRYYGAAVQFESDVIVRFTSDCPLIDPRVSDRIIREHLKSADDYTAAGISGGFPRGLDTEVFSFDTLEQVHREASQQYEREHVTPYIQEHPDLFKIKYIEASGKLRRPDLRLTVDTKEDLKLVREIFKHLYHEDQVFYTEDVIDLLDGHPELAAINAYVRQKGLDE